MEKHRNAGKPGKFSMESTDTNPESLEYGWKVKTLNNFRPDLKCKSLESAESFPPCDVMPSISRVTWTELP